MSPQAALDLARAQQRIVVATLGLTRAEWAKMGTEFDASWSLIGPRITLLASSAQVGAARNGAASVPLILAEIGQSVDPFAEVDPRGFAGTASDGRPLESLLYHGVIEAKQAARTMPAQEALAVGGRWLDMAIHTQVADAGRTASGVAIFARPGIGYVRMVNSPCCSRCAVLAGKWTRAEEPFKRHPRCDCQNVATGEEGAKGLTDDPDVSQIRGLNKDDRQAISDGADLNQVINAKRGAQGMWTTEGTTRQGYASYVKRELAKQRGTFAKETAKNVGQRGYIKKYKVRRTGPRPTPASIYKYADSREEAIKLLAQNGYVVSSNIRALAKSVL